jgi:hypothetical protein
MHNLTGTYYIPLHTLNPPSLWHPLRISWAPLISEYDEAFRAKARGDKSGTIWVELSACNDSTKSDSIKEDHAVQV